MATYRITSPDGRTFDVTAPDGTPHNDVLSVAQEHLRPAGNGGEPRGGVLDQLIAPGEVRKEAPSGPGGLGSAPPITTMNFNRSAGEIRADIAALPDSQRSEALRLWAQEMVRKAHADSPTFMWIDDKARQLARGMPVGSWLDEAAAATSAGIHKLTGGLWGLPYDEEKQIQNARDAYADNAATKLATLPVIGDVTTGGLTKLAGGIASAPFAPALRVVQGASLGGRVLNGAATGMAYGSAYGAGEGDGLGERSSNAVIGGLIGSGLGGLAPAIGLGVSKAVGYVRDAFRDTNPALSGYSRGAVDRLSQAASADGVQIRNGLVTPAADGGYGAAVGDRLFLGREGMVADLGPTLQAHASGLAARPETTAIIARPMVRRQAEAPQRIEAAADAALGPPRNVPETLASMRESTSRQVAPLYEEFYASPVRVSERLHGILDRAQASGAIDRARRLMAIDGYDPADSFYKNYPNSGVNNSALNGRFLDYIKRAIDDLAQPAVRSGERETARRYTSLARELRDEVDSILSPGNPSLSPWAQARAIAGDGFGFDSAVQRGRDVWRRGTTPDELAAEISGQSQAEAEAMRLGARDAMRTAMGTNATAFGPKGDTAARRMFNSEFGQDKMSQIATSPEAARRLESTIAAESRMADTANAVLGNSATARRQEVNALYPNPRDTGVRPPMSAADMVARAVTTVTDAMLGGAITAHRTAVATDAARMLIAQGADRDKIVSALLQHAQTRALSARQRAAIQAVTTSLLQGALPPAISSATGRRSH